MMKNLQDFTKGLDRKELCCRHDLAGFRSAADPAGLAESDFAVLLKRCFQIGAI
jgi:hypothetical protein